MKPVSLILLLCAVTLYSQKNNLPFPYTLSLHRDLPIGATVVSTKITSAIAKKRQPLPTESFILSLDPDEINSFDRRAIYHWSTGTSNVSDHFKSVGSLSPFALTLPLLRRKQFREILTVGIMYLEAGMFSRSVTGIVKYSVRRPRPYLYNNNVPLDFKLREQQNATRSFFSGHTSNAFCGAIFTATVFQKLYPDSPARYGVWGGAITIATTTGILRYYAGKHYPSDILVGALVGSAVGFLIPRLHLQKKRRISLSLHGGSTSEIAITLAL